MLTQSFLYKLSDLAKSSRFLFFMTVFSFGLVQSSDSGKKPAPMKSSKNTEQKIRKIVEEIIVASMNQGKEPKSIPRKPVFQIPFGGAQVCPPWPD